MAFTFTPGWFQLDELFRQAGVHSKNTRQQTTDRVSGLSSVICRL